VEDGVVAMTNILYIPTVNTIRDALEEISGAVRDEPLPERVQQGTDPATEIWRFDPGNELGRGSAQESVQHVEPEGDDSEDRVSDEPMVIFEVPPEITDAEVKNKLGDAPGHLERLQQITGIDALGWYVTFHQRRFQHGVHIPVEGVVVLALGALSGLKVPLERRLELAFRAILRHELYHFSVDCMAAIWELAIGAEVYWRARHKHRNADGYIELEEALANAYMLRGFRHPPRALAGSGASAALKNYCRGQPAGYRDGPYYAPSRHRYVGGCRELSTQFHDASASGEKRAVPQAFDALLLYADPIRIDWRRCPIIVGDRYGLLKSLGIQASFFSAITRLVETPAFLREFAKLDPRLQKLWKDRKRGLAQSLKLGSLGFKRWDGDIYSVRIDGNYRAHLRHHEAGNWSAISIGSHKAMGHG
jgi:hypothetical protein